MAKYWRGSANPTEAELSAIQRRLGAKTIKLEPPEPSAWQPLKRDGRIAKPAVERGKSTPGQPDTHKNAKKGKL